MKTSSVWIVPGFGEGRWHAGRLLRALESRGYAAATDMTRADVIITHSGGCYFLPAGETKAHHIIMINPSYWPGKPLLLSFGQKVWQDYVACIRRRELWYWAQKTWWNVIYIAINLLRAVQMAQRASKHNLEGALRCNNATIIRSDNDTGLTPRVQELLAGGQFTYITEPGEHDDCWLYTERHAQLIDNILTGSARLKP